MLVNISIEKADEILLNQDIGLRAECVPILDSLGYVLAENIKSDINIPHFDKSTLDGYALRSEDTTNAGSENPVRLETIDNIKAGHISKKTVNKGQAIRIMTGAKVPEGADAIVRYEDTVFTDREVKIFGRVGQGAGIVKKGKDIAAGDIVLKKGKIINPADIGILAVLGMENVRIYRGPKVAVLATGDELVGIDETPGEGKIRGSNSYTIGSQVKRTGSKVRILGICKDDIQSIKMKLDSALEWGDMVITTGGASVGDADLIKEAFEGLGAEILFWRVNMKPGGPVVAARYKDKLLFGLSGNPMASFVAFERLVRPAILRLGGRTEYGPVKVRSTLESGYIKVGRRNRMVTAFTYYKNGEFFTKFPDKHGPGISSGSGILSDLSATNSLFYVPAETGPYNAGDKIEIKLLDYLEEYR